MFKVISVSEHPSKYGGIFYYIFFKDMKNNKSYKTCVSPNYSNYKNWKYIVDNFGKKKHMFVDNVIVRENIIDYYSLPTITESDD